MASFQVQQLDMLGGLLLACCSTQRDIISLLGVFQIHVDYFRLKNQLKSINFLINELFICSRILVDDGSCVFDGVEKDSYVTGVATAVKHCLPFLFFCLVCSFC